MGRKFRLSAHRKNEERKANSVKKPLIPGAIVTLLHDCDTHTPGNSTMHVLIASYIYFTWWYIPLVACLWPGHSKHSQLYEDIVHSGTGIYTYSHSWLATFSSMDDAWGSKFTCNMYIGWLDASNMSDTPEKHWECHHPLWPWHYRIAGFFEGKIFTNLANFTSFVKIFLVKYSSIIH